MARRKGFMAAMAQASREAEKASRAKQVARTRAAQTEQREIERVRLLGVAAAGNSAYALFEKADFLNAEVKATLEQLRNLLADALTVDSFVDFEALKESFTAKPFEPGPLAIAEPPPVAAVVPLLNGLAGVLPGAQAKRAQQVAAAASQHGTAMETHKSREADRQERIRQAEARHELRQSKKLARVTAQNSEVDEFRQALEAGERDAIVQYFEYVLTASSYPEGFPQKMRLAYTPESRHLAVEYDLPTLAVVPDRHKYVKSGSAVTSTERPAKQRRALYAQVVAQVTIRTLHELFESDRCRHLDTVVFNGHVDAIDPGTGREIRPCIVTVRTSLDAFKQLDLSRVEPLACLKTLNASVSRNPAELSPVRPVLDFSMVDPRFIEESDVLSNLDQRPNLMELTPSEFESLITNLFEKMGLETRLTQPSRDGGVDCVAFNNDPVLGGKVVIQAKRYKNTVGVSAVRDLFGTVQNEGASKGILVTTSGYGKAAYDFAQNKPLELFEGTHLLHLLSKWADMEAKIQPPDDWKDPEADSGE